MAHIRQSRPDSGRGVEDGNLPVRQAHCEHSAVLRGARSDKTAEARYKRVEARYKTVEASYKTVQARYKTVETRYKTVEDIFKTATFPAASPTASTPPSCEYDTKSFRGLSALGDDMRRFRI